MPIALVIMGKTQDGEEFHTSERRFFQFALVQALMFNVLTFGDRMWC